MARIIYSIGELKGSIGGNTFQRNASGTIVRNRPKVSKSSTRKQKQIHNIHQSLLQQWSTLTLSQRDNWNTFATAHPKTDKFGQAKQLTGANWFTSVNYLRQLQTLSTLTSPPAYTLPSASPIFSIYFDSTTIKVYVTGSIDYIDQSLIIWTSLPTTRTKATVNQIRKFVVVKKEFETNIIDITTEWEQATGLNWNPTTLFPNTTIFIALEVVTKSSGITNSLLFTKKNSTDYTAPPDNAFATSWNSTDKGTTVIITDNNLTAENTGAGLVRSVVSKNSGKHYWEILIIDNDDVIIGITTATANKNNYPGSDALGYGYEESGDKVTLGVFSMYGTSYYNGDIVSVLMDLDGLTLSFWINGVDQGTCFVLPPAIYYGATGALNTGKVTANFGLTTLTYTPPAGYTAGLLSV